VPPPLAEKLKDEYPGIEKIVRINRSLSAEAEFSNNQIPLEGYFVDSEFLNVFTFPLLKGNVSTALTKAHTLLITEAGAARMFGNEDPIGKVIKLGEFGEFEVTGLVKNPPKNSHLQFEILAPYQALEIFEYNQKSLTSSNRWTELDNDYIYLVLPETSSANEAENITAFMNRVANEVYAKETDLPAGQAGLKATFELQTLPSIVPGRDLSREIGISWDFTSLSIFGVLTLLILLPACFNYTNISISRALKRSKEIGLRKVVGGERSQIFFQFILETVIVTLLALGLSYLIFAGIRGEFSSMLVAAEFLDFNPTAITLLYFVGFAIFIGFVAGAFPALYFSGLNPIQALKSKSSSKVSIGSGLRKSLIVGQFALSLGFIMAVVITAKQHIATLNYNFGFTQKNILDVNLQGVDPNIFRNEFSKLSSVQTVSMSSNIMGTSGPSSVWIQKSEAKDSTEVLQMFVDHNYIPNLELKLLAGKSFTDQQEGRERDVIVNEEFLKQIKIDNPNEALDKTFIVPEAGELRIIGVAKNFHYADLRIPIQSFFFRYDAKQFNYANLKVTSTDMHATIVNLEAVWKTIAGERKFEARFFDDEIEEAYSTLNSLIKICGFLGFLAITISCLGLLGMVVYTSETRTKEIGVRKVMGASTGAIAILLSKDYVKLMLIAAVIATPITYLFFDKVFLGMQYYRIGIGVWEIVLSLLLMLVLGVGTILSQTLKAAKANPVDTLRSE
jgi:ABC-type antimicrobial peptide transport system permease subunit